MIAEIQMRGVEEIQAYQDNALARQLKYLQEHSPFYGELFKSHAIKIDEIRTAQDLRHIPTTTKEDLGTRNWDFLCVPRAEIMDYASTSGTMGKPVTIALTESDLERLSLNEAQSFGIAGGMSTDIYQLMVTLDRQFMAGFAYFSGIRKLGAAAVRIGPASPQVQWESIMEYRPNAMVVVPSFILKLIAYAEAHDLDLKISGIEKAICIGEALRNADMTDNALAVRIKEKWDIKLYSTYASTEMQTAFTECEHGLGGHLQPDLLIVEILDENGVQMMPGEIGEVTITTLGVTGMPLLRYRTGDMTSVYTEACPCGRNTLRLSPVSGRKNQMIKYKGTTFFPAAIFEALRTIPEVTDYLVEVSKDEWGNDDIVIQLHHTGEEDSINLRLAGSLKAATKAVPKINFVSMGQIQALKTSGGRKPVSITFK